MDYLFLTTDTCGYENKPNEIKCTFVFKE